MWITDDQTTDWESVYDYALTRAEQRAGYSCGKCYELNADVTPHEAADMYAMARMMHAVMPGTFWPTMYELGMATRHKGIW